MPDENNTTDAPEAEAEAKPTITIAEKQGGAAASADASPTITIAEKEEGGE